MSQSTRIELCIVAVVVLVCLILATQGCEEGARNPQASFEEIPDIVNVEADSSFTGITVALDQWGDGTVETTLSGRGTYWFQEHGKVRVHIKVWENGQEVWSELGEFDVLRGDSGSSDGERVPEIKVP